MFCSHPRVPVGKSRTGKFWLEAYVCPTEDETRQVCFATILKNSELIIRICTSSPAFSSPSRTTRTLGRQLSLWLHWEEFVVVGLHYWFVLKSIFFCLLLLLPWKWSPSKSIAECVSLCILKTRLILSAHMLSNPKHTHVLRPPGTRARFLESTTLLHPAPRHVRPTTRQRETGRRVRSTFIQRVTDLACITLLPRPKTRFFPANVSQRTVHSAQWYLKNERASLLHTEQRVSCTLKTAAAAAERIDYKSMQCNTFKEYQAKPSGYVLSSEMSKSQHLVRTVSKF